jgi:hypothetical protein
VTSGWFFFSVAMPAIVVAVGLFGAHLHDRALRREEAKRNAPAE